MQMTVWPQPSSLVNYKYLEIDVRGSGPPLIIKILHLNLDMSGLFCRKWICRGIKWIYRGIKWIYRGTHINSDHLWTRRKRFAEWWSRSAESQKVSETVYKSLGLFKGVSHWNLRNHTSPPWCVPYIYIWGMQSSERAFLRGHLELVPRLIMSKNFFFSFLLRYSLNTAGT